MEKLKNKTIELLRWSEKYTKTDMVYLAKGGFWTVTPQIITTLSALFISIIFANYVPKEIYGNYKFVFSIISILGALSLTGLSITVIKSVAKGKEGFLIHAVKISLIWNLPLFLLSFLISIYYFLNNNFILAIAVPIATILSATSNTFWLSSSFLNGKKLFKENSFYIILNSLINFIFLSVSAILFKNVILLLVSNFGINLIVSYFVYRHILKKYQLREEIDPESINMGKHLSMVNILGVLASNIDKILIFHFLGAVELAIYSFAVAIPEQIKGVYKNINGAAFPKLVNSKELEKSIYNKIGMITILATVILITYHFAANFIFKLFFPKYLEAVFYSQIYNIGLIVVPGIYLFNSYFQIKEKFKIIYILNGFINIAAIILIYFFVKNFGIFGAVLQHTVIWILTFLVYFFFFLKERRKLMNSL